MKTYVGLSNYMEIPLPYVEKGHNLGESKYDWYVELVDPYNFYLDLYLYLLDEDPPYLM